MDPELEKELKVEDCWRLFKPCRWINHPFTHIRILAEGAVAVAAAASEADYGCVPGGAVVGGEVGSSEVHHHYRISLVQRLGGNAVISFCMIDQTEVTAYSVVGGGVLCWCWHNLLVAEAETKREVGENDKEV